MNRMPRKIATRRLLLRPFRRSDARKLPALLGDWDVARWLARAPHPYTVQDGRDWIKITRSIRRQRLGLSMAVVEKQDSALIGGIGLSFETGEVGYWFGKAYWGRGYATEAVSAITEAGLNEAEMPKLWAGVMPGNQASCRVLEKVGYRSQGVRPYEFRNRELSALYYRLQRWEWQQGLS